MPTNAGWLNLQNKKIYRCVLTVKELSSLNMEIAKYLVIRIGKLNLKRLSKDLLNAEEWKTGMS